VEKKKWFRKDGWPLAPEEWKTIGGWVVRRAMKPAAATRPGFPVDVSKIFRELYPLYSFSSHTNWKP